MRIDNPNIITDPSGVWAPRFLITATNGAGAATVDFVLKDEFRFYEVVIKDVVPGTDGDHFLMRMSSDGGATFDAGVSDYAYAVIVNTTTPAAATESDTANSSIFLDRNVTGTGSAAGENYGYRILLFNTKSTAAFCGIVSVGSGMNSAAAHQRSVCFAHRRAVSQVDAIRFLFETGTIAVGKFFLYGFN